MPLAHDVLLSEMARLAIGQGDIASEHALLDCLQDRPLPSEHALGLHYKDGKGVVPKWVWDELCLKTGQRMDGWRLLELACERLGEPARSGPPTFRYAIHRAFLAGTHAWLAMRHDSARPLWQEMARLAGYLGLGLVLGHCPWRRRFPWLMGLLDRPTIGLAVYTWRESE